MPPHPPYRFFLSLLLFSCDEVALRHAPISQSCASQSRHFPSVLFLFLLLVACAAPTAHAAPDVVWSGLIYATNQRIATPPPRELAGYERKLQHIFGYNQFELLSHHREVMDNYTEHWLLPGAGFCLLIDSKQSGWNHLLALQLYQEKRLLLRSTVLLARQSPIFLKGPQYGEGQLIMVLLVE